MNTLWVGVQQGESKLVLTKVELFRRLMEKQTMRSMEHGTFTDEEIESWVRPFMNLEQ